jgi:hypothetical protein
MLTMDEVLRDARRAELLFELESLRAYLRSIAGQRRPDWVKQAGVGEPDLVQGKRNGPTPGESRRPSSLDGASPARSVRTIAFVPAHRAEARDFPTRGLEPRGAVRYIPTFPVKQG